MQSKNASGVKRIVESCRSGIRSDSNGKPVGNQILNSIPEEEYNLIRADLEYVETPQHKILHEAGDKIEHAYFLNEGMHRWWF